MKQIAALYVETDGAYFNMDGVDPWDEARDARHYEGPYPVVAHPPCNRWTRMAPLLEALGQGKVGDDAGMFAHALDCVRRFGGVLEHPASTYAWNEHGLLRPSLGVWTRSLLDVGWVCEINQVYYGHRASKPTWLYAVGCDLPSLPRGKMPEVTHRITDFRWGKRSRKLLPRLRGRHTAATPTDFRNMLIEMAMSVRRKP